MNNIIVEFAQYVQKKFGVNIEFSGATTEGQSHCPIVHITMYCPYGEFKGTGSNQREAKKEAVLKCIETKGIEL